MCSNCDDRRETAFTHSVGENGSISQLDYLLGPNMDTCASYVDSEVKLCSAWDHNPVYAKIHAEDGQGHFGAMK